MCVRDNRKARALFVGEIIYIDVAMTATEEEDCLPVPVVVS